MAESLDLDTYLDCLKRVDPYAKTILATATQAALYTFNIPDYIWVKEGTQGVLFVYSRNGEPYHSLVILNRKSNDNFFEPIVNDFQYQVDLPFFLYTTRKIINGIWFFDQEEGAKVVSVIQSIMQRDSSDNMNQERSTNEQKKVDMYTRLYKAQEDFYRSPNKGDISAIPSPFTASTPRAGDVPSQSVMDFFAQASTKSTVQIPPPTTAKEKEHVLYRLKSNPAHSVEHIEKQQRSVTPQELMGYRVEKGSRRSAPIDMPYRIVKNTDLEQQQTNGLSQPKQPLTASSPLAYLMQSQLQLDDNAETLGTSPFQQFMDSAQKPLLMTPMMFTTPKPSKEERKSVKDESEPVEMLTEKQLSQALIYLLKNNSDFIKQIHQAYTNSILEKVDKSKDK